jgi:hypothetical protein
MVDEFMALGPGVWCIHFCIDMHCHALGKEFTKLLANNMQNKHIQRSQVLLARMKSDNAMEVFVIEFPITD